MYYDLQTLITYYIKIIRNRRDFNIEIHSTENANKELDSDVFFKKDKFISSIHNKEQGNFTGYCK